jgi:hypothetical protein
MDVQSSLRKLAKSDYFQNIYNLSKERGYFRLFKNEDDFTDLQITFLKYLNFYNTIFTDIALGDVTEIVLNDFMYEDAYIMYKNKADTKKLKENKNVDEKKVPVSGSRWIFKSPPKEGIK